MIDCAPLCSLSCSAPPVPLYFEEQNPNLATRLISGERFKWLVYEETSKQFPGPVSALIISGLSLTAFHRQAGTDQKSLAVPVVLLWCHAHQRNR